MHLFGLNVTDLLVKLWRGSREFCDDKRGDSVASWEWVCLTGDTWVRHGAQVAAARHYLPGSFDRPPRNPAEKINSGYKCWEFLTWIYTLAPALLYGVLPDEYWVNFCMLASGVRIVFQCESSAKDRENAYNLLAQFVYDFEDLYIQRKVSRIHFSPQCMHTIPHMALETFPMECTIGDLGQQIRQPAKPFENLAEQSLRRTQINAVRSIIPSLKRQKVSNVPRKDLGDGYVLMHPREQRYRQAEDNEDILILRYIEDRLGSTSQAREDWLVRQQASIQQWARCELPNRQVARSVWKEIANGMSRMARNVKYAEVQFYFLCFIGGQEEALAIVANYGPPNEELLKLSSNAVYALGVIAVKSILSCVAIIPCHTLPHPDASPTGDNVFFVAEKLGLDIGLLRGIYGSGDNTDNADGDGDEPDEVQNDDL
ncbi:uncharacterized protein BXZ73DRAFT_92551 [Epithele typhae]|uniref:uncharacterized protein n=1 Tax=Epithele typhae TaxID=378194 RepID=UPI002008A620|nr:uncharacterized protein BXZ73DRAFT_92551 [Epithele typhae]KAH9915964.1 hypothetical protein BXZ73DRAFT_92551 [Epithele typhae]